MQKKGDSLRYPSPKNSPVDCFSPMSGSAQSNLFPFHIKKESPLLWRLFFGGKRGIRTLGAFIGHTRFPVVRLRPAQPSFHRCYSLRTLNSQALYYYSTSQKKINTFF